MATKQNNLTQDLLKTYLVYNPDSGIFTRKIPVSKNTKAGDIVGYINNGYINLMLLGINYSAHRLAFLYMLGEFPESDVDHINGIKADNRWCNLRKATRSENSCNSKHKGSNTGIKGIFYRDNREAYIVRISKRDIKISKTFNINKYKTPQDALEAAITYSNELRAILHKDFTKE